MEFSAQAPFARFAPRLQERSPSATITFTQHLSRKGEPCGRTIAKGSELTSGWPLE